jgi:hypothetical protein
MTERTNVDDNHLAGFSNESEKNGKKGEIEAKTAIPCCSHCSACRSITDPLRCRLLIRSAAPAPLHGVQVRRISPSVPPLYRVPILFMLRSFQ